MLTANDLAKQTRPKQSGAEDGAKDFPPTNSSPYASTTERDIQSICQETMATEYAAFVRAITKTRNQISAIRNSLPTDAKSRSTALATAFRSAFVENSAAVKQAADDVERRLKDLRLFKVLNDLNFEPDYQSSMANLTGTAVLIVSFESAANAYFFGQASESGLVGGFFTAGMVSVANVTLGFLAGVWPFRQMNHVKKWRLIWAIPLLTLFLAAAVIFNLIVGHYREALVHNPDVIMLDIVPIAMGNLFGIRSFESIVLILIGICIFGFSFYKGYKVWDTYPGYMSKHRAVRDAQEHLKEVRERVSRGADKQLGQQLQQFQGIGSLVSSKRADLETYRQTLDRDLSELDQKFEQIEQAGNAAMKAYRTANVQVRSQRVPPPPYFQTEFNLDRSADMPELREVRDELSAALDQVTATEKAFQTAQVDLATEKANIMRELDKVIATAETGAKDRAAAERQEEEAVREALGGTVRQSKRDGRKS
jgi:hypothetical protein